MVTLVLILSIKKTLAYKKSGFKISNRHF